MYAKRLIINLMLCCAFENSYAGKSYILPHFYYCSSVWHFCGARDADKLEALNKRILRFILGDYSSPYNTLLSKSTLLVYFVVEQTRSKFPHTVI